MINLNQSIINPLGIVHSPYREKFGVPRQPSLADRVVSEIQMLPPYDNPDAFRGIEQYSHLWLIFGFNMVEDHSFRPLVRPPRLGGNQRLGVFACRSPFRPNSLGLSCVKFQEICKEKGALRIRFLGGDLTHGTPVYDIKPYIAFSDSRPDACSGFASELPPVTPVIFSTEAEQFIQALDNNRYPLLSEIIKDVLSYDPRPAYRRNEKNDDRIYGMKLYDFNIRFKVYPEYLEVLSLEQVL